jgi:hypothetical protein
MPTASARKKFTASESVYLSYYVKYDTSWIGSQDEEDGGPHITHFMTDAQPSDYGAPACSYLTTYSETYTLVDSPYRIYPVFAMQDCLRINSTDCTPPCDLTATTESRAIAGCNGFMEDQATGTLYTCYGAYNNGLFWRQVSTTIPKNQWVRMELYLKMNSIVGGEAVANGEMYNWVDGVLSASATNVVFRTGQYPTQKFDRFLIAPYMGPKSKATQTMWIDELTIYDGIDLVAASPAVRSGTLNRALVK